MLQKLFYKAVLVSLGYLLLFHLYGCEKEYSYEGGPLPDTIPLPPIHDTIPAPASTFPSCIECSNISSAPILFWSFKFDTSSLCGSITNSVITPGRNGFTFFGPSTCSVDSGLIMTVFLDPDTLNSDRTNVTTNNATLEYYDNTSPNDVFVAKQHLLNFTIESYTHASGLTKGTFKGFVKTRDSSLVPISNGKFVIQFQ
ncbi:MAG: hypothetical protein ABI683_05480 [Ginsengibacter sp.]